MALNAVRYTTILQQPDHHKEDFIMEGVVVDGDERGIDDSLTDDHPRVTMGVMKELMEKRLLTPQIIQATITAFESSNRADIFLEAVLVLHKLACTFGYKHVLHRLLVNGAATLTRIMQGLEHVDPRAGFAVTALFRQLASTKEGRDVMIGKGATDFLLVLLSSAEPARPSTPYLLALRCMVSLAQVREPTPVHPDEVNLMQSTEEVMMLLYDDMHCLAQVPPQEALSSATRLWKMRVVVLLLRFLVRHDGAAFTVPARHKAIITLHRLLFSHRDVLSDSLTWGSKHVIDFICRAISFDTADIIDQVWRDQQAKQALGLKGLQSAFLALHAVSDFDPKYRKEVSGDQ